ncbi:prephenate dehydrogenase [Lampropedia aestuarii]|uniref:Prephenate dehydrogenase n=2 Tax=Lampropedia aestuarii TaxID=2562762 RepID=A0A4V3YXB1_9BURK|nr:prephenate dehydrogenase [Lampropedia aestuarii]
MQCPMTTVFSTTAAEPLGAHNPKQCVAVIGYGLIGGSIGLALQATGLARQIRVWDPQEAARQVAAEQLGAGSVADSLQAAVAGADLVLITVPTMAFAAVLQQVLAAAKPSALVSDVASVKGAIMEVLDQLPPEQRARVVPAHPIAGSEQSGASHAKADLFWQRQVIVTPSAGTAAQHVLVIEHFWQALGARVVTMTPQAHDEVFSAVSHLPHLIAFAYLGGLASASTGHDYTAMAGPGFHDFTRIAGANPALWADICVANQQALVRDLEGFKSQIDQLSKALVQGDRSALTAHFAAAKTMRSAYESCVHQRMQAKPN